MSMTEKNFQEKLEQFIALLENTKIKDHFNCWAETDNSDTTKNSAQIRRTNLKNFLLERENAQIIIIGEAPSTGARYTGIPMTSEDIISNNPKIFNSDMYKKTTDKNYPEKTASIVWDEIKKADPTGQNFVIWNAFAFHNKNGEYIQNPSIEEITNMDNVKVLKTFLKLFPDRKIIALGRNAQNAVSNTIVDYIRHPSRGGEKTFRNNFKRVIK